MCTSKSKWIPSLIFVSLFGSYLPPVVCRRAHVLFMLFVFASFSGCSCLIWLCGIFYRLFQYYSQEKHIIKKIIFIYTDDIPTTNNKYLTQVILHCFSTINLVVLCVGGMVRAMIAAPAHGVYASWLIHYFVWEKWWGLW